jgi:hypothetical protein
MEVITLLHTQCSQRVKNNNRVNDAVDKASEYDIAKIIVSNSADDSHLPSKPRKFDDGVCCRAAIRTPFVQWEKARAY